MPNKQTSNRRCLMVERHPWETGGTRQQIQIPTKAVKQFFGAGTSRIAISIRLFVNPRQAKPTVLRHAALSKLYAKSGTRRINGLPEMGGIPGSFVLIEESGSPGQYDLWYLEDKAIVVAKFRSENWKQAKSSQHGRGRLWCIVGAPAPRWIVDA